MKSLEARTSRRDVVSIGGACLLGAVWWGACAHVAAAPAETPRAGWATGSDIEVTDAPPPAHTETVNAAATDDAADTAAEAQRLYEQAKRNLLPLTPRQIRDFRAARDDAQAAKSGGPPPALGNREVPIEVLPGMRAPVVRLSPPFVTSVVFVDATGAPWPVSSVDGANANDGLFSVSWDAERKVPPHNLLTVRPLENHVSGNVVVTLQGFDVPISLLLDADAENAHGLHPQEIDGLLTLKLLQRGPAAKVAAVGPQPQPAMSPLLDKFLYGIPPEGAAAVALAPAIGQAWIYEDRLYYRTDQSLRWPAWSAQANAPGGTAVYEMPHVPLLMLSIDGETVNVTVDAEAVATREGNHDGG